MLSQLLNRPITITRTLSSTSTDDYGNEIPDEETVETVGELQQQRRDEQDLQGETSDTRWLLILPAGADLGTGDTVEVDGHVYEVLGDPWPVRNPRTQVEHHVEATLRRVAGSEDAS